MFDQEFQVEFDDLQVINTGGGDVFSVNGKVGDVVLNAQDVGAATPAQVQAEATARQQADTNLQNQINNKVDKVAGKGLSSNDFTNAEKTKLAGLENYDDSEVKGDIAAIEADIDKNVVNNINITASASTDTINLADGKINIKTGATSSETIPFPVASTTSAGVMNSATYQGLLETTDIANGLLEGAVAVSSLPETPTQAQLTTAWENATGRTTLMNRAVIYDVTNQKLWTYYTNTSTWYPVTAGGGSVDVQPWTNTQAGIVKGSTTDGQIFAENDGTGSVNGWDEVKTDISNLENAGYQTESQVDTKIATAIAPLESDIDDLETGKQDALTAGDNIDITNNVISATDTTYTAGDNITITANEISADVPDLLTSTGQSEIAGMTQKAITDALASAGGVKVLTSADYDYPDSNPYAVAAWRLEDGIYLSGEKNLIVRPTTGNSVAGVWLVIKNSFSPSTAGVSTVLCLNEVARTDAAWGKAYKVTASGSSQGSYDIRPEIADYLSSTDSQVPLSANQGKVLKDLIDSLVIKGAGAPTTSTVGTVGKLYEDTTNGKLYQCTAVSGSTYTWEEVGGGGGGVQFTDLFADGESQTKVQIGSGARGSGSNSVAIGGGANPAKATSTSAVAIGNNAQCPALFGIAIGNTSSVGSSAQGSLAVGSWTSATGTSSVAIGSRSKATQAGEFSIGDATRNDLYNGTGYRLLTNIYDGQSAHDAATYGQLQALEARIAALEAQLGNA